MNNITNKAHTDQQNGIEKIIKILNKDTIFIPKSILVCEGVYEESKMMFSIIFTESLQRFSERKSTALTISKEMKRVLYEKTDSQIQFDCICPKSKVSVIRKEVLHLINHQNISKCIRETGKEAV
ncbi:MAG: hypothetical protein K2K57_00065 [Oscillospiraceae bacterium]|nr:hypothetical protein [Oscillospiraceae bacterium]